MNKAVFLDRDGVINEERDYVWRINDFCFLPGIFDDLRFFIKKGFLLIIITNQAGIARGLFTEEDYQHLTKWMILKFKQENIAINGVYHCPHHPDFTGQCECRKPKPGLILKAQKDHDIDLGKSLLFGDKLTDINAGLSAGVGNNYLVKTGHRLEGTVFGINVIKNLKDYIKTFDG